MFVSFFNLMHCPYTCNVEWEPNVGICITTRCSLCDTKSKWEQVCWKSFQFFSFTAGTQGWVVRRNWTIQQTGESSKQNYSCSAPVLVQVWITIHVLHPWWLTNFLSVPSSCFEDLLLTVHGSSRKLWLELTCVLRIQKGRSDCIF